MKIAVIVLSVAVVILLALVGILWFSRGNLPSAKVSQPADQSMVNANANENSQLIGGQKDEHGCLIGAGYDWCEAKKKCLRSWEEECQVQNQKGGKGVIEGSLGYPSEGIPAMKICAENVSTKALICTSQKIYNRKYTYEEGYRLEVPAGTYHVFASLADPEAGGSAYANYRAYYSEMVTCGLNVNCTSHKPIKVVVEANQTASQIDPIDWYAVGE